MPAIPTYTIPSSQFASSEETMGGTADNKAVTPRGLNAALRFLGIIGDVNAAYDSVYIRIDATNMPFTGVVRAPSIALSNGLTNIGSNVMLSNNRAIVWYTSDSLATKIFMQASSDNAMQYVNYHAAMTKVKFIWYTATSDGTGETTMYIQEDTPGKMRLDVLADQYLQDDFIYAGNLKPYRGSAYTGYAYVPLTVPLTNNSLGGAASCIFRSGTTTIDTSVAFGAPANIKAANVQVSVVFATQIPSASFSLRPAGGATNMMKLTPVGTSQQNATVMVTTDTSGDFDVVVEGINTVGYVALRIWGYCL